MKNLLIVLLLILPGCAQTAKLEKDLIELRELEAEIAQSVVMNSIKIESLETESQQHGIRSNNHLEALEYLYNLIVINAGLIMNFHETELEDK